MKSKIPLMQLSNGLQEKVSCAMRAGGVSESTFRTLAFMLTLFIEEVAKFSLLPEESCMLANLQVRQGSKSRSSWLKFKHQMMSWGQFINASLKGEV